MSENHAPRGRRLLTLSLGTLGVVYGDIGTSPLYAMRECFHGSHGIGPTPANVLGVLSLIFWALIIVISAKYLVFVMRADNGGEGGIMALMSLLAPRGGKRTSISLLVALGLFGAALLYGDGMITPAISVLSAVEGLKDITHGLSGLVLPLTVAILIGLFAMQRWGSGRVGKLFGPVTLVWFGVIAVLGILQIAREPHVLVAASPSHAIRFLAQNGRHGFLVLGAVFLVATGGEALYADMGHFGARPIRLVWFVIVLPCLLLNYFGQGALLLREPSAAESPFYRMAPGWALIPLVVLATAATVIASQAVITGAFSLTRQAVQLGYVPRMKILHTSAQEQGQIYVPAVNRALMVCTIGLVLGFRSSSNLAAAYGVAVTATMVITTILLFYVARERWKWSMAAAGAMAVFFLVFDLAFFGANMVKVSQGGWFPLAIAAVVFTLMTTWRKGRQILNDRLRESTLPVDAFLADVAAGRSVRVPGTAVYMSRDPLGTPPALLHNFKHNKVVHKRVVFLTLVTEDRPVVGNEDRVKAQDLGHGIFRVVVRYGFQENPNVPGFLSMLEFPGLEFPPQDTSFFLARDTVVSTSIPGMAQWREKLFGVMLRNAGDATAFFCLPPNRVVELGAQIQI